jgi:hypothetical protein
MIEREQILAKLERLISEGSLAWTSCSREFLRSVRPLIDAGVVAQQRSGAGRRLAVINRAALLEFRSQEFPGADAAGLGGRVDGVARFRDSKSVPGDTAEVISVRAWMDDSLTSRGEALGAAAGTQRFGVFSFVLNEGCDYALSGGCAIVENPAVFLKFELLKLPVGLVLYGRGRLSERALEWLGRAGESATFLHLPDYDPAGLSEYSRLRRALGKRVRLHLPDDLESRFARFSNRALLDKPNNRASLASLRSNPLSEVKAVIELIHRHNAGLEQEALLLS